MGAAILPPEIEAAIDKAASDIVETGISIGRSRAYEITKTPEWWVPRLKMTITSALAAAREAGQREVLEGAAGVETSLLKLAAVAYSQGTHAVRARIGEDGADRDHLRASGDLIVAEQSHRAAIAADKARAVEGLRPVLSHDDADRLVASFLSAFANYVGAGTPPGKLRSAYTTARAALLAALTGAGGG